MMTSLNRPQRATMDQLKSPAIETMTSLKRPQAESHNQKRPKTKNHYDFIEKTWEETYDLNEKVQKRDWFTQKIQERFNDLNVRDITMSIKKAQTKRHYDFSMKKTQTLRQTISMKKALTERHGSKIKFRHYNFNEEISVDRWFHWRKLRHRDTMI